MAKLRSLLLSPRFPTLVLIALATMIAAVRPAAAQCV
jgi:hypothetical protein